MVESLEINHKARQGNCRHGYKLIHGAGSQQIRSRLGQLLGFQT